MVVPEALQRWEALFSLAQSLFDLLATGTRLSSLRVSRCPYRYVMTSKHFHSCLTLVDLKPDNILVGFEDDSVINDFVRSQESNPMARKIKDGRVTYRSHNEFGSLKSIGILPKIADFGLAKRIIDSRRNIHPIQPDHYRAPEVVLGIGWSYSADIWNLGVLVGLF